MIKKAEAMLETSLYRGSKSPRKDIVRDQEANRDPVMSATDGSVTAMQGLGMVLDNFTV